MATDTLPLPTTQDEFGFTSEAVHGVAIEDIQVVGRNRQEGVLTDLANSIAEIGLLHPIVVTPALRLVCGARRLAACKSLGWKEINARIVPFTELEAALAEIDENFEQKPLTVLEKAEQYGMRKKIYEALHPSTKHGGKRGNQYTGGLKTQEGEKRFCKFAAEKSGLSDTTIQRLVRIGKLAQKARDLIRDTEYADSMKELSKLARITKPQMQIACAEKLASGKADCVSQAKVLFEREERLARVCHLPQAGIDYRLILGDFFEVADQVDDNSLDAIICDPPYVKESLWVFDKLGEFAAKKLKEGGSLVAMVGQYYLPQIVQDIGKHLAYHWTLVATISGPSAFIKAQRVEVGYKPMLWYTKGKYVGRAMRDVVKSGGVSKEWHPWGQSEDEFAWLVSYLTKPGDMVCDPFLGGATTAAAALRQSRKFIGIDIEPTCIQMGLRRIDEVKAEMAKNSVSSMSALPAFELDPDEPLDCTDEELLAAD